MKQMNKWTCLLVAALVFSACGNEDMLAPEPDNTTEPQTTKIVLGIDPTPAEDAATRAGGSQKIPAGYMLRCIAAAYTDGLDGAIATETKYYGDGKETDLTGLSIELSMRLMPGTRYNIVAWADYVKYNKTKPEKLYYDAGNLTKILRLADVEHDSKAEDTEDAYTGKISYTVPATTTTNKPQKLSLTRPLTKIIMEDVKNGDSSFSGVCQVVCKNSKSENADMTFNALTGEVEGKNAVSARFTPSQGDFSPYIYIFKDIARENLEVVLENGGKEYGIASGGSSSKGQKITILQAARNTTVVIKAADNSAGEGQPLKLYPLK